MTEQSSHFTMAEYARTKNNLVDELKYIKSGLLEQPTHVQGIIRLVELYLAKGHYHRIPLEVRVFEKALENTQVQELKHSLSSIVTTKIRILNVAKKTDERNYSLKCCYELMYHLSEAGSQEKSRAALQLANFYLDNGLAAEALSFFEGIPPENSMYSFACATRGCAYLLQLELTLAEQSFLSGFKGISQDEKKRFMIYIASFKDKQENGNVKNKNEDLLTLLQQLDVMPDVSN